MGNIREAKVQQLQRWSDSRKLLVNGYEPYGRSEEQIGSGWQTARASV